MNLQFFHTRPLVPPAVALWRLLGDIEALLSELPAETYRARLAPRVSGSVGEHVRHCLDQVSALLAADPSTPLSYDRRHRGTTVETDPTEALRQIFQIGWLHAQADFHDHQWPLRPHLSVRMQRPDARTVSRTVVNVTGRGIELGYTALSSSERRAGGAA